MKHLLYISVIAVLCGSISLKGKSVNQKTYTSNNTTKADTAAYTFLLKQINKSRDSIYANYHSASGKDKMECIKKTENYLIETYYKKLIPYWFGTKWEFYGETQIPGDSSIACGHFVVTTLKHLGMQLQHSHEMATNYSAYMVNSLCDTSFKVYKPDALLEIIKIHPDDIWVVGLKNHSALIVKYQGQVRFVHSSYFSPTMVIDEPIEESQTFYGSNIYVAGNLFKDNSLTEKWINREEVVYTKKY